MASDTLKQILVKADTELAGANGPVAPPDAVLEQTLRDFIQIHSRTIAIATSLVGVRTVPWLEFKWYTGTQGEFTYPVDDAAIVDPTKIGTKSYTVQLAKGQGRVVFLDTTLLRGESWENMDRQQMGIIQARADLIDNKILTDLKAGAAVTVAAAGGGTWGGGSADPEADVLNILDGIFANGRVSGNEGVAFVIPANRRSILLNTQLFGNVIQSLQDHLEGVSGGTTFAYTRDYGTGALGSDALALIPGAGTAEFFEYNGPGFQETELTRLPGVGWDWLLTSYFGSIVHQHQDGAASGTTYRIAEITGVN